MHSSINRYLGCFHLFSCNVAMNIHIQVSVQTYVFSSLPYIPRNGIAGLYVTLFHLLRNYQSVFHSGYTILHSHQQGMRIPTSPQPHQHLLLSAIVITAILVGMKKYLNMVFFSPHTAQHVGFQFPYQGVNPHPLQWKLRVLTTGPPGKSFIMAFFFLTGKIFIFKIFVGVQLIYNVLVSGAQQSESDVCVYIYIYITIYIQLYI